MNLLGSLMFISESKLFHSEILILSKLGHWFQAECDLYWCFVVTVSQRTSWYASFWKISTIQISEMKEINIRI